MSSIRRYRDTLEGGTGAAPSGQRLAAMLLLAQFVAMWAAFGVLAPSINWPASLDEPPSVILPLILAQAHAVFAGYLLYFLHAILLVPLAVLMPAALGMSDTRGRMVMLFGAFAGFAKAFGIVRWLFLMPGLASAYVAPDASDTTRHAIETVYGAFNAYAGGIGEILGVGLFAGIWTLMVAAALVRAGAMVLGLSGLGAGLLLLATLASVAGVEIPVLLTISGIAWQIWTFTLAVHLWKRARVVAFA